MASSASSISKSGSHERDRDIISTLPDAILSHILSFLPTKYSVLTSILSTRWRNIWTLVPTLDFDDSSNPSSENFSNSLSFMKFVDQVLILRNSTACIQKFNLNCRIEHTYSQFNTWIRYVIASGVRDLNLSYCSSTSYYVHLPQSLFTCKMLEVLKLKQDFCIHVPNVVFCLPSLRVLHLICLIGLDDPSFEMLISSCPVLEELVICKDENDALQNLKICSSSLKSLKIHSDFTSQSEHECSLSIDAPFLEYLDISEHFFGAYSVSKLSTVVKANIDLWLDEDAEMVHCLGIGVVELFRGICNVKHLSISTDILKWIFNGSDDVMPTFCNLTTLEVKVRWCGREFLPDLLHCTPEVSNLVVKAYGCYWEDGLFFSYDMVKCLSRLEIIEIQGFQGRQREMEFIRDFLANSMVLKKMSVLSQNMGLKQMFDALKILTKFPRRSSICELVFS